MSDNRYGSYNEDGTVTEPEVSILTETRIFKDGSIAERVTGTTYFYRIEGQYLDRVTPEKREEWQRGPKGEDARPAAAAYRSKKTEEESNS